MALARKENLITMDSDYFRNLIVSKNTVEPQCLNLIGPLVAFKLKSSMSETVFPRL